MLNRDLPHPPTVILQLPLHSLRGRLLNRAYELTYPVYAHFTRRGQPAWQIAQAELVRLPPGSLGRQLGYFLQAYDLQLMPGFERHDVFHTLLGYDTTAPAEVQLQWCLLGNGKRSVYSLISALGGALFFPEHWGDLRRAYRRGQSLRPFHHWYFEYLLRENLADLRDFLAGKPVSPNLPYG
ncbi:MAG: hypothetical protein DA408_12030 [Bacteroidetes bacterium]|nr:MAG: hypothetical protein C7N36_06375 [Bacteroidota bacterium]PTM12090.1 MAG: hypothetical protein DA408_12030 [Bacteroidota bacterium]